MSNKMLIDASHPEETRVAVVRGNRIEEYDFESQEKKQLRGNIYLAKVTRVEPSLQAAFIDYGGNRHGFLAFSEIHPDYYQIPVADRQALLEAEAEEARAARESEEANDDLEASDSDGDDAPEAEAAESVKEKKKPRRRRSRKAKAEDDEAKAETDEDTEAASEDDEAAQGSSSPEAESGSPDAQAAPEEVTTQADAPSDEAVAEKPKRRTTRRKPARKKTQEAAEDVTQEPSSEPVDSAPSTDDAADSSDDSGSDDKTPPTTMAAENETDEISEPLPEAEAKSKDAETEAAEEEKPAPKKRRTSRARKKPKETEVTSEETESTEAESPEPVVATVEADNGDDTASAGDSEDTSDDAGANEGEAESKPKSKPRSRRRSRSRKAKTEETETDNEDENGAGEDAGDGEGSVESVGQEDALEEVPAPRRARRYYKIQEVIKRRQVLLVQVVKEERGTKGAALTTYLSLAGRYSVLMPNTARGGGISRKITNSSDRKRLKSIAAELEVPEGMGVILRTAGASRTKDEITRDFEYLMRLWGQVRNLTLSSTAPCLVYEEGSLIKRSIRDLYDRDTGEVIVAGEAGFQEAKDFMNMLMPSHANKVKTHRGSQSIFAKYGVESHLEKMVSPQVTLKSGGYLIINQTEALVAVDVNSGRATREHSVEDTALQTNLEAAEEVARQLRLRDLAGLIVIDFIDMEERRNNRAVEKKLKECLKNDRARIQVGRISHFGLLEMSRQRMRASVLESTMDICPHCAGTGYIRSDSAIALHVFRAIEEHVSRHNRFDCVVKTTPSIAIHILNHKRAALLALEEKYGLQVIVEGDREITGQDFVIAKGDAAQSDTGSNAVGYQNEAVDADAATEDDEAEGGKKRRNRRRKRKSRDEDRDAEVAAENAETSEAAPDDNADEVAEKDDGKRKRGKRNGRKPKSGDQAETDNEASDASADASTRSETTGAEDASEAQTAAADAEPERPKRRSTVRRKAPIAAKPEPETDSAASNGTAEATETSSAEASVSEPPRPPRRRTTRRKKASETEAAAADDEAKADGQPAPDTETEVAPEAADAETEKGEDKKSGWWRRGGGLF